jgi:glycosyltransferase involved in cell wall biosynthesis
MRLLVLYSSDLTPRSQVAPGGINGNLRSYLGALPADWDIEVWGAAQRDDGQAVGTVRELPLRDRTVRLRAIVKAGPASTRNIPLAPRYAAALAWRVWRGQLVSSKWDCVIAHRAEFLAAAACTPSKYPLPPFAIMLHSNARHAATGMSAIRGTGLLWGERIAVRRCDRAITVSHAALLDYQRRYPRYADRFTCIPNGVDLSRFVALDRYRWRNKHRFDDNDRVIVYHGRYDEEKGILRLLEVVRLLIRDSEPWHLVTAGTGPLRGAIALAAGTWGRGHIHDLGYLEADHVPSLLAGSDLGILVSDLEGLSNGLLENLAAGRPIVATDVGDNRHILSQMAPELITGPDPESIVQAIRWTWSRRLELSAKATTVAQRYSLEHRLAELEREFIALAAPRR